MPRDEPTTEKETITLENNLSDFTPAKNKHFSKEIKANKVYLSRAIAR